MAQLAITEVITTIAAAEERFGLHRDYSSHFFTEWTVDLPELSSLDHSALTELWRRYLYHRSAGHLLESTVMLLLVSPLLAVAGFYDPPFRIRAEESVRLTVADSEEVLQGRIDVLVLLDQLWVVVLESRKTMLSVWSALPQALAYLMANPSPDQPCFGLLTSGDEMIFVKVLGNSYSVSRVFSPLVSQTDLESVWQVLRTVGQRLL